MPPVVPVKAAVAAVAQAPMNQVTQTCNGSDLEACDFEDKVLKKLAGVLGSTPLKVDCEAAAKLSERAGSELKGLIQRQSRAHLVRGLFHFGGAKPCMQDTKMSYFVAPISSDHQK